MELPQGNSLCSYLKQAKCHVFLFYKIREQLEDRTGPACGGVGTSRRGEEVGKECGKVNIMLILCAQVCNWKIIPVETSLGMEEGEDKGQWWRGKFKYDIFDIGTFVCNMMHPHPAQQ
jgi:hypothetical protein